MVTSLAGSSLSTPHVHRMRRLKRSRRPTAGMIILLVLLLTGLLNFPSVCNCGAELPHAHSLFMLADHHHTSDGELDRTPPGDRPDASATSIATNTATSGPILQGPADEFAGGGPIGLSLAMTMGAHLQGLIMTTEWLNPNQGLGVTVAPESPPPQFGL